MYCFLLHIFMFQLSSALTPRLHTNPASTINASLNPFEASMFHYSLHFLIDFIETRGVVGHLPPTLWKVGGGGTYFTFYGKHFISNWIFSIKEKKCYANKRFEAFLIVCFLFVFYFACRFLKLPSSCAHQKTHPLSDPFLKLYPHLCNL